VTGGVCTVAGKVVGAVGGVVTEAAGAVGNGMLELLARWVIGAATQVTTLVSEVMAQTSTPRLESSWFEAQFTPMADLGAALGLLVALIALSSAAIRRSPEALAATLSGILRAGLGTGLILALTTTGLSLSDQVSADVLSASPHAFWATVAAAWGGEGFGGFGSSALAMLIALIEVFAAVFVWLELIVRAAAIYVAVLFFPASLAAAIWPALASWPGRLGRLLLLFVILKPVALIVLSLAGNAAAAGLSVRAGLPGSAGDILAATVIYALAAFAPWALMYLLAADAESAYAAAGLRAAGATAALAEDRPSLRSVGGLRDSSSGGGSAGGPGAGGRGAGPGSGGGGSSGGGGPTSPGGPAGGADGSSESVEGQDALPVSAAVVGMGSVGAAAGVAARAGSGVAARAGSSGGLSQPSSGPDEASPAPGERPGAAARPEEASVARLQPRQGGAQDAPPGGGRVVQLPLRGSDLGAQKPRGGSFDNDDRGASQAPTPDPPPPRPRGGDQTRD
jgi:hypothetical protein